MRVLRRLVHALLIVVMLLVGAATAAAIVSQTAWFKNRVRVYVVSQAANYLNGNVSIQKLSGNFFTGVELEQIAITVDGEPVVAVDSIGLEYNLIQLITRGLSIDRLSLNQPVVRVRHDANGWSISNLLKKEEAEADRRGPQFPIRIDVIEISDGTATIDDQAGTPGVNIPERIQQIDAKASFEYEPVHYSIDVAHLSFRASEPQLSLNSLSGGIAVRDDSLFLESVAVRTAATSVLVQGAIQQYLQSPVLNLRVTSDKTSLPEVGQVVPSLANVKLEPAYEVTLNGPLDRLGVDMNVRSSAGELNGTLTADLMTPGQSVSGDVSVRHLNLAPIVNDPKQASDITADATVDVYAQSFSDLDSLSGTVKVDAPQLTAAGYKAGQVKAVATAQGRRLNVTASASAYGASATTTGHVVLPKKGSPVALDLRGTAKHLDIKKLPRTLNLPPAATDVNADYHVVGTMQTSAKAARPRVVLDARFADSVVPGARILPGSTAHVDTRAAEIAYSADASVADVDLQRLGEAFSIPALADQRYASDIDGHVVVNGQGTAVEAMNVTAEGDIADTSIFGGRIPQATFNASVANGNAHIKAIGTFADFDPAVLANRPELKGMAAGSLDVDAAIDGVAGGVTLDDVAGTVRLILEPSNVGGLAIQSGNLDADYRAGSADVRRLNIVGPDVNLSAQGALALNDTGQSNLAFHAQSSRLNEIGKLFDVPVSGIGQVEGTITGNRAALQATGALEGSGIAYEENSALTLRSNYTVNVPDLDFQRASATADSQGTFVKVAGQEINEVTAKTSYDNKTLQFDGTATQPKRSLAAVGSMLIHPDHQEVHLTQLTLTTANQQWAVPQGSESTINYAQDSVAVKDLRLVSTDQEIIADGQFGKSGGSLNVTANNVDLARVDELLLRPPQFSGRLNARARIEGTRDHPTVNGEFEVAKGGFRQFTYDTLTGTLNYQPQGVTVDARLQQTADQWITAKGYLPTAVFSARDRSAEEHPAGHVEPASEANRVDLAIDSSPLGLGIIQGFTTEVSNVQGTFEAHVRVTGAADDPHPSGRISVANGAMTVPATGVSYAHINGDIDLAADRVHIDQLTVLDNHDSALSVTGDLAVHERDVGAFHLWINAEDFKVIDNKMGNVRVQSAMEVAGELRSPEVRGYFGVTTGRVNLDELLALAGPSPYSTEGIGDTSTPATEPEAKRSIFDTLRMNVHLTVPDDLIVTGRSLQAPGSPIGLGAINVTLGGDLTAEKDAGGQVRLRGSVNTVRGTYDFQGRRFEILRDGAIRFDGLEEFNPRLDLRTRRLIQGVEARVNVRGTLQKPEILLSSTPPQDEADILALIVFNQPVNQLGAGQQIDLAQRAQQMATGAVTGQLSQSIAKALNLETFELNLAPEDGGGPALTIGQQVGPNLYVKVQQGIADQTSTNLIIEYAFTNWLRLQTNVVQGSTTQQSQFQRNQGTGADLIFLFTR